MSAYGHGQIARVAHEAVRALQAANGETSRVPPWAEADEEDQKSTLASVRAALGGADPEDLFEEWKLRKLKDGWTCGPKNLIAKTHPCLVDDYAELPEERRVKDRVFVAIARAMSGAGTMTGLYRQLAALRELLDEVGILAANAPEDGDSFGVLEEIAMRIAGFGVGEENQ